MKATSNTVINPYPALFSCFLRFILRWWKWGSF